MRETQLKFCQLALEDEGSDTWKPMTLKFSDQVLEAMELHPQGPADYLRRRLVQTFKRTLGCEPDFWLKVESFSKPGEGGVSYEACKPHVHGAIQIPAGHSLAKVRSVLQKVTGVSSRPGRSPVTFSTPKDADAIGWVDYALETAPLDHMRAPWPTSGAIESNNAARPIDGKTVAKTRNLNRRAQLLYELVRLRILATA